MSQFHTPRPAVWSAVLLIAGGFCVECDAAQPAPRKVLFFDLWKLDAWNNVELRQGRPEWIEECDYRDPAFADAGVYFPSVWKDDASGTFRLIYSVKWSPFTLMAATSDDGVHWSPLPVEDAAPGDEQLAANHLLTVPSGSGGGVYQDPQRTDGYAFRIFGRQSGPPVLQRALADPQHHWHEIATQEGDKPYIEEGITLASKDGLHWEIKTGGKWNWQAEDWYPEPPVFAFWNEDQAKHVMIARPGWGDRRQCLLTSSDLRTWSDPRLLFQPDSLDTEAPIGMYGMPVTPVGNGAGYAGLLWIFRNSSSEPVNSFNQFFGTMEAELVYSYDGERFNRTTRRPFLERNPIPQPGCVQVRPCSIVETDRHVLIYSEGHKGAHGRERAQQRQADEPLGSLLLHRLRKDGWMSITSKGDWASFQTKPFALFEPTIRLNAAADYGRILYQLTDEKSRPIDGLTFKDCVPMNATDALDFALRWKSGAQPPTNTPLRLEMKFRQANVYSLEMSHHFLDAHDLHLLKDGKALPENPRFDY